MPLLAIAFMAPLLASCGGAAARDAKQPQGAELRDPSELGPYGVSLTRMTFERPATADGSPRSFETWIWYPAPPGATDTAPAAAVEPAGGSFPVVVFSHGNAGQPTFYTYFTEHLASWGFIVVAPSHPGNTSADCFPCDTNAILASARERPDDVTFILDQVLALEDDPSQPLGKAIDPSRTALAGHSFGGWTAIFAATSGRFGAIIALAPGLPETLLARAAEIGVPVLIIGAGKDELVPPDSVRRLHAALAPTIPVVYVSLPEGHHTSFNDRCFGCTDALPQQRGQDLVNHYATTFLETYIVQDDGYAHYLRENEEPDAVIIERGGVSGAGE